MLKETIPLVLREICRKLNFMFGTDFGIPVSHEIPDIKHKGKIIIVFPHAEFEIEFLPCDPNYYELVYIEGFYGNFFFNREEAQIFKKFLESDLQIHLRRNISITEIEKSKERDGLDQVKLSVYFDDGFIKVLEKQRWGCDVPSIDNIRLVMQYRR